MGRKLTTNGIKKPKDSTTLNAGVNGTYSHHNGNNPDELEQLTERLARLEASQSGGHTGSDVYKFVLFFIMGVVMTVFLYPHAAKTVESLGATQQTSKYEETYRQNDRETFVDVDDKTVGNTHDHLDIVNETLSTSNADNGTVHANSDGERISDESDDIKLTQTHNLNKDIDDTLTTRADKGTKKHEDPLIGEEEEIIEEKPVQNTFQSGERVQLFSMDGNEGELPVTFVDENGAEISSTSKTSGKGSEDKHTNTGKKSKKNGADNDKSNGKIKQKKTSKNTKNVDKAAVDSGSSKLPDEIKNFKPSYQKTITPKKIFADGRRIPPMELLPQKPNNSSVKVWMFELFLSEAECDGLMRVHNQHVEDQNKLSPILCFDSVSTLRQHLENVGKRHVKVSPKDFTKGTTCVNATFSAKLKTWLKGNWSYSTAFYPGESRFASIFEDRVQQAMGLKPENGGKFQITSYPLGIGYKSHTDCTESTDKRDRVATVLVYLDTVSEGGETDFPELGIWVRPRKARALLWNNMNDAGECEPLSIHQAKKVAKGHKVILQRWYYYKSFYSLGKRPPEPPLPKRASGQPRVSCDEYEYGSCRWYDEWNFEHMLEYERQKYNLV